ncbi:MAG TPA: SH3 domain-containing protein [Parvularculaceae bacterium]|nr:aspartyl-trna synthetase [Caulobacterales bacterium]HOP19357.1 SH3 domain-containing protein [Amphiplicatus sp.]HPE32428.1 SH3 domain-containing protein [Parvularculaceae bacterium]HRX39387.1 SH3 domain-containing protein [Parvularculaceae bacterium]
MRRLAAILIFLAAYLTVGPVAAQAPDGSENAARTDTPSGFPVPRFVSLKNAETYCRQGPSFDHPVAYTFLKAGLPVQVVAETTDHWRKIRDHEGSECWAHQTTLRAVSHVIVEADTAILVRPEIEAPVRARLRAGVIARIERASGDWRLISVGELKGWAPVSRLWGAE